MTCAVCFNCGGPKVGAFVACGRCGEQPETDDELAVSLVMTSRHLSQDELRQLGVKMRSGGKPRLDAETRASLRPAVEEFRRATGRVWPANPRPVPRGRRWWRAFLAWRQRSAAATARVRAPRLQRTRR